MVEGLVVPRGVPVNAATGRLPDQQVHQAHTELIVGRLVGCPGKVAIKLVLTLAISGRQKVEAVHNAFVAEGEDVRPLDLSKRGRQAIHVAGAILRILTTQAGEVIDCELRQIGHSRK